MPEGPEIKRLSSRLKKVLVDKALASVEFTYQGLGAYNQELLSQKIVDVDSRGKALIISFSEGLSIYSHNQLYGKWLIVRSGKVPKTNRSQRLVISTNRHSAFLFSASDIQVLKTVDLGSHPFLSKLGPDALGNATTKNQVLEQLVSKRFRRRSLGALLLDQGFIAGLGNLPGVAISGMGLGVFEEFADYILGTEFRIGSVFLLLVLILVYRRFKLSRKREYLK